jgi:Ni/Co efflux regulator RcnB
MSKAAEPVRRPQLRDGERRHLGEPQRGQSWTRIAQYLPYVTSVHAATID